MKHYPRRLWNSLLEWFGTYRLRLRSYIKRNKPKLIKSIKKAATYGYNTLLLIPIIFTWLLQVLLIAGAIIAAYQGVVSVINYKLTPTGFYFATVFVCILLGILLDILATPGTPSMADKKKKDRPGGPSED